jgi:hypothetical protein
MSNLFKQELSMGLHEEYEDTSYTDFNYEEKLESLPHKKRVKRLLEDRLERKRLRDECKDEFNEFDGEFNWDDIEK